MAAYVITSWHAQPTPDGHDEYVHLAGRRQGLISWILGLLNVSPAVSIKVSGTRVEFSEGSLSGSLHRVIPLPGLCSTVHGYHNPWKAALVVFVLVAGLAFEMAGLLNEDGNGPSFKVVVLGLLIDLVLVAIYFVSDRKLTLGFIENSGLVSEVQFKQCKIEGQDIDLAQAAYVCELVQMAMEARQRSLLSPAAA